MHKGEHKNYVMSEGYKNKIRDQVYDKPSRRETTNHAVKKNMNTWENTSSDSDDFEHSDDAFMAK